MKKTSKKLALKKENLRTLTAGELQNANGGTYVVNASVGCAAWSFTIQSNNNAGWSTIIY